MLNYLSQLTTRPTKCSIYIIIVNHLACLLISKQINVPKGGFGIFCVEKPKTTVNIQSVLFPPLLNTICVISP